MDGTIEDRGPQNPRQAGVDRIRDAALANAASQRSKAQPGSATPARESSDAEVPREVSTDDGR